MGDSEVLIKIAADVASAVAAMQSMVEQVMAMVASMKEVGDQSGKTGDDVDDMHKKMAAGAGESVAAGIQLSKAYDVVKDSVIDAVKSFPDMIAKAAEAGDHFFTLSNRLNVSVESLAEMDFIAKQSGASMEGMARTVQSMGTILSDSGSKGAKGIKSIGLSVDDLKAMKPEEAFFTILEAIQDLPPGIDKNAKAMEIFGGKFRSQTMLLKEDIGELRATFKDVGGGMTGPLAAAGDAWGDTVNTLRLKQETWKNQTAGSMLPTLTALVAELTKLPAPVLVVGETVVDLGQKFVKFSTDMIASKGWAEYKKQMLGVVEQFNDTKKVVVDFAKDGIASVRGFVQYAAETKWSDMFSGMKQILDTMKGNIIEFAKSAGTWLSNIGPNIKELAKSLWTELVGALQGVRTAMSAMMGPWGLVAAAAVLLIATLYELMGGWDGIKKSMGSVIQFFKDLWVIAQHLGDIWKDLVKWVTDLTAGFKKQGEAGGVLGTVVKVLSALFEGWVSYVKLLVGWIPALFNLLGKATHDYANELTAADEAQKKALDSTKPKAEADRIKDGFEQMADAAHQVGTAYTFLNQKYKEQITAALASGASSSDIAKNLSKDLGGEADIWGKAVDKMKKDQEDLKKAVAESALGKLTKEITDLDKAMKDAAASGSPMSEQLETMGKKAAEVAQKALQMKGQYEKLPADIKALADAYNAAQLAEKTDAVNKKVEEMGRAFEEKATAGVKAASDAVSTMQEEMTSSTLTGTDARIAAINKQEVAALKSVDTQSDAVDKGAEDEVRKIQQAFAEKLKAVQKYTTDGTKLSDERTDALEAEERAAIQAARDQAAGQQRGLTTQRNQTVDYYAWKRQQELKDTGDVEADAKAWGLKTKQAAKDELKVQEDKFAFMLKHREDFTEADIKSQQKVVDAAKDATDEFEVDMKARGIITKKAADDHVQIETDKLATLKGMHDHYYDAQIAAQQQVVDKAKEAAGQMVTTWNEALGQISGQMGKLGSSMGGTLGKTVGGLGGIVGQMGNMAKMTDGTTAKYGVLSQMQGQNLDKMGKMSAGVGAAMSVAQGAFQVMDATNKRTAGQRALGGAMAGAQAGAAFGPYGMAVGAAAGLVVGLVRGKPAWAKATDEIGRDFGAKVSDELGKAIAKDAKEKYGGDRAVANVANIAKIIQEAGGIDDKNAAQMTARLRDTFSMVATGKLKADEGRKVLDESFGAFADHVVQSGKLASKNFTEIIALNQESGLKSKGVVDFVVDQTGRLGQNIGNMVAASVGKVQSVDDIIGKFSASGRKQLEEDYKAAQEGGDKFKGSMADFAAEQAKLYKTAEEGDSRLKTSFMATDLALFGDRDAAIAKSSQGIERLERLTMASFNASIKGGADYLTALNQMGPALDNLNIANEQLGRTGSGAIQELMHFREVASANQDLVASAGSLNEVMLALSNIGGLTTDSFADLETQGNETFDQLQTAGFTEGQSLQQMKGFLESVRDAHEQLGYPIDENTQKMLDQAEANGVLSKKQMSTNDVMMTGLTAVIEALGGKVPAAFKTMADSSVDAGNAIKKSIGKEATDSVMDMEKHVKQVPFDEMASAAMKASKDVQTNMAANAKAVGGVQDQLNRTDWGGWAKKGVDAAYQAKDAVDALSYGHSPGGIKDVPILLDQSAEAAADFAQSAAEDFLKLKDTVDAMDAPNIEAQMAASKAAQNAQNKMMAAKQAQLQQAQQGTGEDGGGAAGGINLTFEIRAFDPVGMQTAVEEQILPQILETLRRGRMLTSLRELVR